MATTVQPPSRFAPPAPETVKLESHSDASHAVTMSVPSIEDQTTSSTPSKEHLPIPNMTRGVIKYWILCCVGFCVLAPLISVLLGFFLHTKGLNYVLPDPPLGGVGAGGRTVSMSALLVSADPTTSVITFDWSIDSDTCLLQSESCTDVNIFFDNNLLASSSQGDSSLRSSDIPSTAFFRFNATANGDIRANSATFRTDIRLFQTGRPRRSALINYPFDTYITSIFMFAQDSDNNTVNLHLDEIDGNAVGFSTKVSPLNQTNQGFDSELIFVRIDVQRGALIIAFCIIITIAIWLITLALFLLSFTAVVFGFRQRTEVLIIPVATIFAFTQLRGSMPGAPPGFGDVLDFIGLLPCLGILSFSCALTLGALLFTDPSTKTELTWAMIKPEILPALGVKRTTFESMTDHGSGV